MKLHRWCIVALSLAVGTLTYAQRPEGHEGAGPQAHGPEGRETVPRANQGRVPPAPEHRGDVHAKPEVERYDNKRINGTQHVNNDHWYGHDRPGDKRYHIDHPWEHGHFEHFGPSYRYHILRIDRDHHRFWLPGGYFFDVAAWDWSLCMNWCWDCADDFVVYEDPDHAGWYLLYNVHTGAYVHVTYMGT